MADGSEVRFRVRVRLISPWERLFVVGSHDVLGKWMPSGSVPLQRHDGQTDLWVGSVKVPNGVSELRFRYLIGYYLDPAKEGEAKRLIVSKWESIYQARCCLPDVESSNGIARESYEDVFGSYDGKQLVSDSWLTYPEETVVLLRIHGEALKFYKSKYKSRESRLKIVPFDVRFREVYCNYDSATRRRPSRGILWRLSSIYSNTVGSSTEADDPEDTVLPDVPPFSNTELMVLTREDPIFGEQYQNGSVFRNNVDYLVFRTRTVAIENLAFRIELYHDHQRVGMAYALPAALPDTYGKSTLPLISTTHTPVGQIDVNYMLIKPLSIPSEIRDSMAFSFSKHWRKRKTLEVGHRGMGNSYTKTTTARENTIFSLNEAARMGADFVEFDVQLTKDLVPIVFHDFHVLVEVAGRNGKIPEDEQHKHHEMAVKDLKLAQLNLLHFEHQAHSRESATIEYMRVIPTKEERLSGETLIENEHNPFPILVDVLRHVNKDVGFNIEVKYPMWMKNGSHECENYFERNLYIDTILKCVYENANGRRILFSSFDPDICTLISQKQHIYPVLFLVVGTTMRYTPFQDIRSDCSKMAVNFAAGSGLLGVNFHSEELLKDRDPRIRADKYNLVTFVWGDDLNIKENLEYFKNDLKVDGIIYDRIGLDEKRQNVFLVERNAKQVLFQRSPVPSRRNSVAEDQKISSSQGQSTLSAHAFSVLDSNN